ncbi:MAG: hypothetical protein JXB30_01865 [Anaerolineae bacterium]|nr:hypothetical protein [Anaerolineae bacterium]
MLVEGGAFGQHLHQHPGVQLTQSGRQPGDQGLLGRPAQIDQPAPDVGVKAALTAQRRLVAREHRPPLLATNLRFQSTWLEV